VANRAISPVELSREEYAVKAGEVPDWRAFLVSDTSGTDTPSNSNLDVGRPPRRRNVNPGDLLSNRFHVRDFLGRGGMGEVFAAEDTVLKTMVAIKVMRPEFLADEMTRKHLIHEVKTARSVTHSNVCRIFDFEESTVEDGSRIFFLTMELLHGETLSERLSRKPKLTKQEAEIIALQICDAFSILHGLGIVHRDFKPGNVMLVRDGVGVRSVIMDFGVSLALHPDDAGSSSCITQRGAVLGTPAYMAPEQLQGAKVTTSSDVYALGIVFAQMLTGLDVDSLIDRSAFPPRLEPSARTLLRLKDPRWCAILDRCLDAHPSKRYASAVALRARIKNVHPPYWQRRAVKIAVLTTVLAAGGASTVWYYTLHADHGTASRYPHEVLAIPTTPYERLKAARERLARYDKGDNLDSAITLLSKVAEEDPNYAPAYADLAQAYLLRNATTPDVKWTGLADSSATRAVALNPDLSAAHVALGAVLQQRGSVSEAEKEFQKGLTLDPKSASAYVGLGECAAREGKALAAEKNFSHALRLNPNDWTIWGRYGVFEYSAGHYEKAAAAFQNADRLAANNSTIHRNLGAIYSKLGRLDDAASEFQRALEIRPSDALYTNLGTIRFYQGRYSDAIPAMQAAVRLSANNYLNWGNLADAYRLVPGNSERATEAYRIAARLASEQLQKSPTDADLHSSLAVYLAHSEGREAAARQLKEFDALRQQTPSSFFKAALASEASGNDRQALHYLKSAVKADYPWREIETNPDLASLRKNPEFQRLSLK
jgi:eukaryotic-like serine/threonine-protein kinase